ncbi:hypothetical protein QUF79_23060 [Fictibacillus enclensis]|uniref:hypothetical protein n=1 Tax=Fictibacillus enclensis TaxID=1017270 RepID=UPI0025A1B403|nr:hypothetical protein [Fictibacillus enclensis]MDM5200907.1 hypothetical protein [Fictibacillus enclensis]
MGGFFNALPVIFILSILYGLICVMICKATYQMFYARIMAVIFGFVSFLQKISKPEKSDMRISRMSL